MNRAFLDVLLDMAEKKALCFPAFQAGWRWCCGRRRRTGAGWYAAVLHGLHGWRWLGALKNKFYFESHRLLWWQACDHFGAYPWLTVLTFIKESSLVDVLLLLFTWAYFGRFRSAFGFW
jgi:hypothetical protein